MHCPFLCRHLNKKRANQNQHSADQQRNWLDELVFNYLDFVPLDPNTTPYYKKYTPNLRSTPKRVLPSWLQGPQQLNYKHDAHQAPNYGQSRNSVPLAQTEGQKYLVEKMKIQRAYRIVPPFSKQKNATKIVKDEKVDERLEYKRKNIQAFHNPNFSKQAETVAWSISAKSSHIIKSKPQIIKDDQNQLIVIDESKIQRPERLYYKPFSKRKSMEIKDKEAELKNYQRSASQKKMRLQLQEQQLIELYSLQKTAKPKKKQVKAKNLEGITNKWKEDVEKKVSKVTSTQPSKGGRNFKISETSMNNESKPKATMRKVSEKKATKTEHNIEDLLTDEIAKTPTISDYNIPSVKKKKRTQQKLFHLDVSVYPVKSKKAHKLLAPKDYPNKVQNKNKSNKLAAQAATKYIIKKMQRNKLANATVGVPEQNKTKKGKSKAAAAKATNETNIDQTNQGNSSDDSIDKLINNYSMRYIHNKNRISSSRRASAKFILKRISAMQKANEITKPEEINAQEENPIKVVANTTNADQLNEKRTISFIRKSIRTNRTDGRRSVRQSIKLQRLLDKRMEPRYKEYLKKLNEYDNEKLNKASESCAQLHSDKNPYKSMNESLDSVATETIGNDPRSATSLSERFYESETTFSEKRRRDAAERTKLESEIRELMQIVETRDELPVKKIQRNFVLEAQTQSWPTKRPHIEKAAKLKRFELATKWEKIYLPESPKPIMLRRYCRKPPPPPPPPELPVVEPAKCACASCQHLDLGKLEDDPPLIRDMKAAWQKLQLKNYYRFIIRRSALECQEPNQFENKCSHDQIICS